MDALTRLEARLWHYATEAEGMAPEHAALLKHAIFGAYRDALAAGEREAANALVARYRVGELVPV